MQVQTKDSTNFNALIAQNKYLQMKGVIQGGFLSSDILENASTFYLGRARLDFTGELANHLSYRLHLEFVGT
ncbi:MAG: hypothetical protein ACK4IY_09770, partial [Chitinophagales bacterium]